MPTVARKAFTYQTKQYQPGDVIPEGLLDKYQKETFLRTGMIVRRAEPAKPVVRRKAAVEVKPLAEVETGE